MKNATKILFGFVAITFGVIYLGDVFDLWSMGSFEGWWTLIIIIPAIGSMLSSRINYANSAFLLFGIWLLISEQKWIPSKMLNGLTISIALIALGVGLIYSEIKKKKSPKNSQVIEGNIDSNFNKRASESNSEKPSFFAAFGLNQSKSVCQSLSGGDATAIFGGIELDLSNALPKGNVTFYANAIFGGIDIVPPKGFNVEITGVALLGGCDNKVKQFVADGLPIFTIKYFTLCGGIDIVDQLK